MNEKNNRQEGLNILKDALKEWNESKKDWNEYYVFFPKFIEEERTIKILFPIFDDINGDTYKVLLNGEDHLNINNNDKMFKLIAWMEYDLINYNLIRTFEETEDVVITDFNILDYKNELYISALEKLAQVFKMADETKKEVVATEAYNKKLNLLKAEIEKFQTDIDEVNKKLLENPPVEKAEEKVIPTLNTHGEEDNKGNNKRQVKSKSEQTVSDISQKVEVMFKEFEGDIESKNANIDELKNDNSEKVKYDFEWNEPNGLRYVSDKVLKAAYMLIKYGKMSLKIIEEKGAKKIRAEYMSVSLCQDNYTIDELVAEFNRIFGSSQNDSSKVLLRNFTRTLGYSLTKKCENCNYEKCVPYVAMYILYLRNNGLLEDKLKEREEFRKNNEVNDNFDFIWNVEDGLKKVTEKVYNFAKELVDKDKIYVDNFLTKDGFVTIYSAFSCNDFKMMNLETEKITDTSKERSRWGRITRKLDYGLNLCNTYPCRLEMCPYLVAGYIYYLKKSGKEEEILADREYYNANKEEIDKEVAKKKSEKLKLLENEKNNYLTYFEDYKDKVKNLEDLIDSITNTSQMNFYCTVEGEDINERKKLINIIVSLLKKNNKIQTDQIKRQTLQNFASSNAYSITLNPPKKNEENKNESKTEKKNIDYSSEFDTEETAYIKMQDGYRYKKLTDGRVYVLTGISEFIRDFRIYKESAKTSINRNKQFNYTLELLTKMNSRSCIILDGTEEEINQFLELSQRLKFIYQNYRFMIPSLTVDEMFNLYTQKIKNDLIEDLRTNYNDYKKNFIEYVSLNKSFIPFSNTELADYLAMYSNSKDKLVFPENMYKKETIDESLRNIIGLDNVKKKVKEFEKYMLFQVKAKTGGLKLQDANMHMIFTGNPGTGKTTIARIMAKMLFDLGIIKENKLVEVERKDLIGQYIGQTAPKTAEVIQKAMGGVLFIDEAYSLAGKSENDFGSEAIATLIKAMEDHKDELVVIFAGYKDEMKNFLDINPGISSRIGYTFDFNDYTSSELIEIFKLKIKNMGFLLAEDVDIKLKNVCDYYSRKKDFGNGRFVDRITQETILKHAINEKNEMSLITKDNLPSIEELNNSVNTPKIDVEKMLENIIGLKDLKEKIKEFEKYVKFIKEAEKHKINIPNQNLHMIFAGNPGTGKTTVARIMAKMLFELGVIHENKLVEVERKDLIGQYIGQTALKTSEVIEKSIGGVLFIDEAYSLASKGEKDFGTEAISTLVKAMEDHKGDLVVIFAGYKKEMEEFINMNSGIASRIGYTFDFPDYNAEELAEIYYKKIEKAGFRILPEAEEEVIKIMKYFCNVENIGNGRFADKVFQETIMKHAKGNREEVDLIILEDIPTINEMTKNIFNGKNMIDPSRITEADLRKTAIHETGHAVVRMLLFKKPGIKKITINPEGTGTLGYVKHSIEGSYTQSKKELMNDIKVFLAGIAAEQVFLGEFKNGGTSDLEKATNIAKNMIMRFGMSSLGLGQISNTTGEMGKVVYEEINKILSECFDSVIELISINKEKMSDVVEFILENKEITEEELIKVFENN